MTYDDGTQAQAAGGGSMLQLWLLAECFLKRASKDWSTRSKAEDPLPTSTVPAPAAPSWPLQATSSSKAKSSKLRARSLKLGTVAAGPLRLEAKSHEEQP